MDLVSKLISSDWVVVTVVVVVGGVGALVCLYVLYASWLHPLAPHPGPWTHRVSDLPLLYHCWKGDVHYYTWHLHQQYGACVRIAPNKLSFNEARAWHDIYGYGANVSKPEDFYSAFRVHARALNTFNTTDHELHRRKRKIMSRAFSVASIAKYEGWIVKRLDELVAKLHVDAARDASTSFNMASMFEYLMLDVFGGICFGESFGFVAGRDTDLVPQFHRRALRIHVAGHARWLREWGLDRVLIPASTAAATVIAAHAHKHTLHRLELHRSEAAGKAQAEAEGYRDVIGHLMDSSRGQDQLSYSDEELVGEAILILIAGFDTSSTVLSASLWYILKHPQVCDRLVAELYEHHLLGQDAKLPTFATVGPCKYLEATMLEAMRLAPAFPSAAPRVVGAGGLGVADRHIPAGTWVSVPPWTINRNECYFENPHEFVPDRWLTNRQASQEKYEAFQPFQLGPRHCIGKHLAVREVMLVLARLFVEFDMGLAPADDSQLADATVQGVKPGTRLFRQTDVYTSIEHGPIIRIKPREKQAVSK